MKVKELSSKLENGFWCSRKLYATIQKEGDCTDRPWFGLPVHFSNEIHNNVAYLVEKGKITKIFDIDWGLH